MSELTEAMQGELQALEAELAADPRYLKVQYLRGLLELYGSERGTGMPPERLSARAPFVPRPPSPGRARDPRRLAILEAAIGVLRELNSPHPVTTGEVYHLLPPEIAAQIGGKSAKGNLSALMHHSNRLISHGRAGWSLPSSDPTVTGDTDSAAVSDDEGGPSLIG